MRDDAIWAAVAALHDEAHADDKVIFDLCLRQSCKDVRYALDQRWCDD